MGKENEDDGLDTNIDDDAVDQAELLRRAAAEKDDDNDDDTRPGNGSGQVPLSRLHEVVDERNEARRQAAEEREARVRMEERLKALEEKGKAPEPAPVDVRALRRDLRAAILSGDDAKADDLEEKIEAARQAEMRKLMAPKPKEDVDVEALVERRLQARELKAEATRVISDYPFLSSESANANKALISEVGAMRDVYINRGEEPAEALRKAIKRLKPDLDEALEQSGGKPKEGATPDELAAARKLASQQRNGRIQQPPSGKQGSPAAGEGALDPDKMDKDEWGKLPASEREKYLAR